MTPLQRLVEHINALTKPAAHHTRYNYQDQHGTLVFRENIVYTPSLLDQLAHTPILQVTINTGGHPIPGSRPAGSIEGLDALETIRVEAARLHQAIGGRPRQHIPDTLRGLIGRLPTQDDDTQHYLATCSGRWLSRALSVTGWADPAWRPNNTCPNCETKRSLRIRVVTAVEVHASCVGCGEVWTPETIGLLAEYIRWENQDYGVEESA